MHSFTEHLLGDVRQQRQAHEQPIVFYSMVLGFIGPVMVLTVPPIRKSFGWKPAEAIPTTYPRELVSVPWWPEAVILNDALLVPKRARRPVEGYEDDV